MRQGRNPLVRQANTALDPGFPPGFLTLSAKKRFKTTSYSQTGQKGMLSPAKPGYPTDFQGK
jgi:hypothetical protein